MTILPEHADCDGSIGQSVTCDRCGRTWTCTPPDPYYCVAGGGHRCDTCMDGSAEAPRTFAPPK